MHFADILSVKRDRKTPLVSQKSGFALEHFRLLYDHNTLPMICKDFDKFLSTFLYSVKKVFKVVLFFDFQA